MPNKSRQATREGVSSSAIADSPGFVSSRFKVQSFEEEETSVEFKVPGLRFKVLEGALRTPDPTPPAL
jgi:hypothetical protein